MIQKEIWIQVENIADSDDVIRFISSAREELKGDIPVLIYVQKAKARRRLPGIYNVKENAIPIITEKYGDDNVKVTEEKIYSVKETEYRKEVLSNSDRIADALELIAGHLDRIDDSLADISAAFDNGKLYICGEVMNYGQ